MLSFHAAKWGRRATLIIIGNVEYQDGNSWYGSGLWYGSGFWTFKAIAMRIMQATNWTPKAVFNVGPCNAF